MYEFGFLTILNTGIIKMGEKIKKIISFVYAM